MERIASKLNLKKPEDWYRVSLKQICEHGGATPLRYIGLLKMLEITYPSMEWDNNLLTRRNKKACQFYLRQTIESLYPGYEILEDYRHPQIQFSGTNQLGELDVYIPELQLAFEYNGEHHYRDIPAFGPVELYKRRDEEKMQICKDLRITLVTVPYWWDETTDSLLTLIINENPKLEPSLINKTE